MFSWDIKNSSARQEILHILKNRKFSAVQKCRHTSLTSASLIQSTVSSPVSFRPILTQSSNLLLGLRSGLLPSGIPTIRLYVLSFSFIQATRPCHPIFLNLIRLRSATLRTLDFFISTSELRTYADTISVTILPYSHVFLSKFLRETPQLSTGWRKELRNPT